MNQLSTHDIKRIETGKREELPCGAVTRAITLTARRILELEAEAKRLQKDNAALVAHVELLSTLLRESINNLEWYRDSLPGVWIEDDNEHLSDCQDALNKPQSLFFARRDAQVKAEAIMVAVERGYRTRDELEAWAEELRRQASGGAT